MLLRSVNHCIRLNVTLCVYHVVLCPEFSHVCIVYAYVFLYTLGKSSNRSPEIFSILDTLRPKIKQKCLFGIYIYIYIYVYIFFAPFSSENHNFPITQQCKKKNMQTYFFFLPTYPTKKYRVGV